MNKNAFLWPVRVYYEDTDAGGVVYHSNYLKYMERARTEWLRHLGYEQDRLYQESGLLFAVSRMEIHFRAPARLDNRLLVSVTLTKLGRASLVLEQAINQEKNGQILIEASVRIAMINETFRPTRLPKAFYGSLTAIQNTPLTDRATTGAPLGTINHP